MSPQATLQLDSPVVECAGSVLGSVLWWGNDRRHPVGVVLRYRTQGRGDVDAAVVTRCELGTADSGNLRFRLDVPADGPVTYHGQLLRLTWQVAVHVPVSKASARSSGLVVADLSVVPWGWTRRPAPPWGSPG